jgi:heme A synthase
MAAQHNDQTNGKEGKVALYAFYLLFAIYFVNVIFGKVTVSYGLKLPHVGNVAEFLLLSVACVALIVAALKREAVENKSPNQTKGDEK